MPFSSIMAGKRSDFNQKGWNSFFLRGVLLNTSRDIQKTKNHTNKIVYQTLHLD